MFKACTGCLKGEIEYHILKTTFKIKPMVLLFVESGLPDKDAFNSIRRGETVYHLQYVVFKIKRTVHFVCGCVGKLSV